jgi:hypothetical protein
MKALEQIGVMRPGTEEDEEAEESSGQEDSQESGKNNETKIPPVTNKNDWFGRM